MIDGSEESGRPRLRYVPGRWTMPCMTLSIGGGAQGPPLHALVRRHFVSATSETGR